MVVTKRYNVLMCHANMKADRCFRIIPQYCSLVITLSVLTMFQSEVLTPYTTLMTDSLSPPPPPPLQLI